MGLADFSFSLQMRDTIQRLMRESIDTLRPRYRYAKVVSFDRVTRKCTIIFNGETEPVIVNMGSIQPKVANQTVRVEGIGTDKYITDVIGENQIDEHLGYLDLGVQFTAKGNQMQKGLTGGGIKSIDSSRRISWSQRFVSMTAERGFWIPAGYFDIAMPPDGTVIPNFSGGADVVVGASKAGTIQLPSWGGLWYLPPWGEGSASKPGNFRITQYDAGTYGVPGEWLFVCALNHDPATAACRWGTGEFGDYWRDVTLLNSWINLGSGYATAAYRKLSSGQVEIKGLIKGGVTGTVIANLPVGYRPGERIVVDTASNDHWARYDIEPGGNLVGMAGVDTTWLELGYTFYAEN